MARGAVTNIRVYLYTIIPSVLFLSWLYAGVDDYDKWLGSIPFKISDMLLSDNFVYNC